MADLCAWHSCLTAASLNPLIEHGAAFFMSEGLCCKTELTIEHTMSTPDPCLRNRQKLNSIPGGI